MKFNQERLPPPYGFISTEKPRRDKVEGHDHFHSDCRHGYLIYEVTALSHIHIGTGTYAHQEAAGRSKNL
ncbi:hypothetical protein L0156_23035, partial [bacterium]|nr:hypothetical protein [bacterium]